MHDIHPRMISNLA